MGNEWEIQPLGKAIDAHFVRNWRRYVCGMAGLVSLVGYGLATRHCKLEQHAVDAYTASSRVTCKWYPVGYRARVDRLLGLLPISGSVHIDFGRTHRTWTVPWK